MDLLAPHLRVQRRHERIGARVGLDRDHDERGRVSHEGSVNFWSHVLGEPENETKERRIKVLGTTFGLDFTSEVAETSKMGPLETAPGRNLNQDDRVGALESQVKRVKIRTVHDPRFAGQQIALSLHPLVVRCLHPTRTPVVAITMYDRQSCVDPVLRPSWSFPIRVNQRWRPGPYEGISTILGSLRLVLIAR